MICSIHRKKFSEQQAGIRWNPLESTGIHWNSSYVISLPVTCQSKCNLLQIFLKQTKRAAVFCSLSHLATIRKNRATLNTYIKYNPLESLGFACRYLLVVATEA